MARKSSYPTTHDMLYRRQAVARQMAFENLAFVADTRSALLRGEIEPAKVVEAKTLIVSALQKARRNAESAKFLGCALHRI